MDVNQSSIPTNRFAILSFISTLLTMLSFCIAVAPIPFTGFLCYPSAGGLGLAAFVSGLIALRQIRSSGGNGRTIALVGVWMGSVSIVATLCMMILGILWLPLAFNFIRQIFK